MIRILGLFSRSLPSCVVIVIYGYRNRLKTITRPSVYTGAISKLTNKLFPLFIEAGGPSAPIAVMLRERQQIELLLQILKQGSGSVESTMGDLKHLLEQHNFKEEGVLYLMLDKTLVERHKELVEKMFKGDN